MELCEFSLDLEVNDNCVQTLNDETVYLKTTIQCAHCVHWHVFNDRRFYEDLAG